MSKTIINLNKTVFVIWVGLIALLLYRNYTGTLLGRNQVLTGTIAKSISWYDIYAGRKKIGFSSNAREKVGDEIIIRDDSEIRFIKDGRDNLVSANMKCVNDSQYSLKSFEYSSHLNDEKGLKASGRVDADDIIFFLESPEKRKTYKIPKNVKVLYLLTTFIPALVQKNPTPGSAFTVSVLDLSSFSIVDRRVVLEEIRPVKVGINVMSLYKFRSDKAVWWASENGTLVKEFTQSGITFYSQSKKLAPDYSSKLLLDYTALPFVKSNKLLPEPEKLSKLKVKIKNFALDPRLYRQSRIRLDNDMLSVEKISKADAELKTFKLPYERNELRDYVKPDKWVSSDYKPLQDTGQNYARTHKYNGFRLTNFITGYVYNLIKTTPIFLISDSKDILKTLSGDFPEKTIMFATYTRAGGLPTRLVGGFVYLRGYFYFHTWPEVWLGEWVPADPAFDQFPADVTHIPLKEGTMEDIISLVDELKNVKIEVVEAL